MSIPILILAAGQSSRMRGVDKLLMDIDGIPMLRRVAEMACKTGQPVLVTLPKEPHPRWAALDGLAINRVATPMAKEGINASLRQGIAALPQQSSAVMILLADLPDLTIDDMHFVLKAVDAKTKTLIWRGATQDGKPGHPVVFSRSLFPDLSALTGDTGAQSVVLENIKHMALIPLPQNHARLDLDTPEDWAKWRQIDRE